MNRESKIAEKIASRPIREWMTTADVRKVCPACADKMDRKGIQRVKASVVFGNRGKQV